MFGVDDKSSMTPQSQLHNQFVGLNDVLILENIPDLDTYGSSNPIDLDDVNVFEMEQGETRYSWCKREVKWEKSIKC